MCWIREHSNSWIKALTWEPDSCGNFLAILNYAATCSTKEAPVHHNVKQAIVDATEKDTSLMFRTLRNTARVFKNKVLSVADLPLS